LGSGHRDATDRQRTLQGAIAWSFGLLETDEQRLFARLGVFAGGWSLEAAEAVCDREDLSFDVLEGLSSLVDKSLVRQVEGDEDRFSMLETIRSYAAEKLQVSQEVHDIKRAHAEYFRELAEEAEPHLVGEHQKEWLDQLERELDNLRAGLQWLTDNDVEQAGRCAIALRRLWEGRGLAREGYTLSLKVLERGEGHLQPILMARLCHAVGSLVGTLGDHESARSFLEWAMSLFQESADEGGIATAMLELAYLSHLGGDNQRAERLVARATETAKELGDKAVYGRALFLEATVSIERGDHKFSEERFRQSLAVRRDAGDKRGVVNVLMNLGGMYLENEQPAEAREVLEQSFRLAQDRRLRGAQWDSRQSRPRVSAAGQSGGSSLVVRKQPLWGRAHRREIHDRIPGWRVWRARRPPREEAKTQSGYMGQLKNCAKTSGFRARLRRISFTASTSSRQSTRSALRNGRT